jgi:hypothetical protein
VDAPANSDQSSHSSPQERPVAPETVDHGDQDIDTAATNAYDEFASERGDSSTNQQPPQRDTYARHDAGDAVDNDAPPIGLHDPSSMPRWEDDPVVLERSPEFHDRPGSGKYR